MKNEQERTGGRKQNGLWIGKNHEGHQGQWGIGESPTERAGDGERGQFTQGLVEYLKEKQEAVDSFQVQI